MTTLDPPASPAPPAIHSPPKPYEPPVVAPGHTQGTVTDQVNKVVFGRTPLWWLAAFGIASRSPWGSCSR